MTTYLVQGTEKITGRPTSLKVDGNTAEIALAKADRRGIEPNSILALPKPTWLEPAPQYLHLPLAIASVISLLAGVCVLLNGNTTGEMWIALVLLLASPLIFFCAAIVYLLARKSLSTSGSPIPPQTNSIRPAVLNSELVPLTPDP